MQEKPKKKKKSVADAQVVYGDVVDNYTFKDMKDTTPKEAIDELVKESERLGLYDWQQGVEQDDPEKR